jgi:hypothetical protein
MKKLAIIFIFVLISFVSFGQSTKTPTKKKRSDPQKKEVVKTVPRATQKTAQIKKAQVKKAQMMNKKKKQVARKSTAIRRKRNGR